MITDLAAIIHRRASFQGHPCTEVLYTYVEDGVPRNACTRVWHVLDDSPAARASEVQAFKQRRQNWKMG